MTDDTRAFRLRVTGRVQGVAFRAWTEAEARRRGLAGWVRNEADGSVAALIAGPAREVEAMLAALRRGPPAARVNGLDTEEVDPAEAGPGFRITG
jgi:acylphosphatase